MRPFLPAALLFLATTSTVNAQGDLEGETIEVSLPRFTDFIATDAPPPLATQAFAKGTWTAQAFLSGTYGFDDGDIYLIHVGVGYHIDDALSVNLDFVGGYTFEDEDADPNQTLGFDLMLRLHVFHGDGWSVFVEGGAGMLWFNDEYPQGGTRHNFSPQLGAGITCRVLGEARLLLGVRWHHISNAGKSGEDRNPGYDGIMAFAGIMIPF